VFFFFLTPLFNQSLSLFLGIEYYENGKISFEGEYKAGNLIGKGKEECSA